MGFVVTWADSFSPEGRPFPSRIAAFFHSDAGLSMVSSLSINSSALGLSDVKLADEPGVELCDEGAASSD